MKKNNLFGKNIEPACAYCRHGSPSKDQKMVLCIHQGVVAPYYKCRKFFYNPLKRIPKRQPPLPHYEKDDFSL